MSQKQKSFKILVLGEIAAGKSCLIIRFTNGDFREDTTATIGVDVKTKDVTVNKQKYTLKIWDTAGQEKFYSIGKTYYNGVNGIVIAFDLSESGAIKKLNGWLSKIKENIDSAAIPIVIVGTKCDLKNVQVKKEAINVIASLHKSKYFETSAKKNINVDEAFQYLAEEIVRRIDEDVDEVNTIKDLNEARSNNKKDGKCCH